MQQFFGLLGKCISCYTEVLNSEALIHFFKKRLGSWKRSNYFKTIHPCCSAKHRDVINPLLDTEELSGYQTDIKSTYIFRNQGEKR